MSEQLIPLSDEDRQVLTRNRKAALIWGLGFGTVALLLLSALILFHTFVWLIIILTLSFALAVAAVIGLNALRSLSKDLRGGQKQMISGPVEAQNIDVTRTTDDDGVEGDATYRFWIQIGGKKVTVREDQYYQFKKGDLTEAFIAPHSETVLGVNKETLRRPFS
jgi:hypothetical protein